MMYIVYCVETHGECVENGVRSVELFHNSLLCYVTEVSQVNKYQLACL